MGKIGFPTFLFSLLLAALPARADDCLLDSFQRLLDIDDKIIPDATLPSRVRLNVSRREAEDGFRLSEKLWKRGFQRKEFRAFVESLAEGKTPTEKEAADFRLVRSRVKQLRVAFAAFDEKHAYPEAIDRLAASMGHVQDALKNGATKKSRKEARALLDLLSKDAMAKVNDEIRDFRPASEVSSRQWFHDELDKLAGFMGKRQLTPKEYHDMRKVISRIVSVFDVKQAFNPHEDTKRVIEYLGSLNGEMGMRHDEIISETMAGDLDYRKDFVPVPKSLRNRVRNFVDRAVFQ